LRRVQHLGDAKVTEPQPPKLQEDVMGLQVAVQNVLVVQVEQGQGGLAESVQDLGLWEVLALAALDLRVHIAALAVDHHDVQELAPVEVGIFVPDDVGVPELL